MIDADVPVFPNNVASLIATRFTILDDDLVIIQRPLRASDPNETVGIFPTTWGTDEDSYELKGRQLGTEPTIGRYLVLIQGFVKDADQQRGLVRHSILAKMIRAMLYRDTTLAVQLQALSVDLLGTIEQFQRWGIRRQSYLSNDVQGQWLYLSTTEMWFETSTN